MADLEHTVAAGSNAHEKFATRFCLPQSCEVAIAVELGDARSVLPALNQELDLKLDVRKFGDCAEHSPEFCNYDKPVKLEIWG